jgi:hypothetical protein
MGVVEALLDESKLLTLDRGEARRDDVLLLETI